MRFYYLIPCLLFALISLSSGEASASCTASGSGSLTVSGAGVSVCRGDATRIVLKIVGLGFCEQVPDVSVNPDAISECTNVLAGPAEVDLRIGSTQSVPMVAPRPGTYGYTYRIAKSVGQFSAVFNFTNDVIGGTGLDVPFNYGDSATYTVGKYCQPPSFTYDWKTVDTGTLPSSCASTPPTSINLATFNFNSLFSSQWEPLGSIIGDTVTYSVNPAADQNVFLLDGNMKLASGTDDVEYGLLVTRNAAPIVVSDSIMKMNVKLALTNAINVSAGCPGGLANCIIYTPWINGRVVEVIVTNAPKSSDVPTYE